MEHSWWLARLLVGPKALLLLGLLVGLLLGENDTIRSCKHHQSHSRFGYCHSSHRSSHNLVLSQAKLLLVLKNHFQTAQ